MAAATKDIADFSIKPEAVTPTIPTSEWPLLLKNYDQREFASSFFCRFCNEDDNSIMSTCANLCRSPR